jgi:hypothetical protein
MGYVVIKRQVLIKEETQQLKVFFETVNNVVPREKEEWKCGGVQDVISAHVGWGMRGWGQCLP